MNSINSFASLDKIKTEAAGTVAYAPKTETAGTCAYNGNFNVGSSSDSSSFSVTA